MNSVTNTLSGTDMAVGCGDCSAPLPIHLRDALPCPFCGSTRIVKGARFFAICVHCGATGPERNADATQGKYTRDWNTRHALPNTASQTDAETGTRKTQ